LQFLGGIQQYILSRRENNREHLDRPGTGKFSNQRNNLVDAIYKLTEKGTENVPQEPWSEGAQEGRFDVLEIILRAATAV
jgi:hypothetical protein